ncbi:uncharacterized protein LOC114366563, partial [Ostrinia furnacalis]|uniref:uncharacterized protein LOC114366563 n=1 Tax=Ostrinia furnacalis TaxID=93504 RepID=UPI00103B1E3D
DQLAIWSAEGTEEGEDRERPQLAPQWLHEPFSRALELADAALTGHTAGVDSCEMVAGSDAHAIALGCALLADALHELTTRARGDLTHHYIQHYRENYYTESLLPTALRLIPSELLNAAAPPPHYAPYFHGIPDWAPDGETRAGGARWGWCRAAPSRPAWAARAAAARAAGGARPGARAGPWRASWPPSWRPRSSAASSTRCWRARPSSRTPRSVGGPSSPRGRLRGARAHPPPARHAAGAPGRARGHRGQWAALARLVAAFVAPALIRRQLDTLLARQAELEDTEVTVHWTTNEAIAVYRIEERPVELWVRLEPEFPLALPRVTAPAARPAVSTNWVAMYIAYQNGTILNAVKMWCAAISSHVESAPPCYVCYCRLHPATGHLPQVRCHQCRNRFHTECIHKWFVSSHRANCPLCRSNF